MRHQQVEAWALEVVERVTARGGLEDDRVELKSAWPSDHRKTARQIAGHANQAHGDNILWIVGVNESRRAVVEVEDLEMSDWWARVARCFDEVAPDYNHLLVPTPSGPVHAIVFNTTRAPYLVTTGGDRSEREVPWRAANGTRSARRSEILRSLVEEARVPRIECYGGTVSFDYAVAEVGDAHSDVFLRVNLRLYFEAAGPCTLPAHRWRAVLDLGDGNIDLTDGLRLAGPKRAITDSSSSLVLSRVIGSEPDGTIRAVADSGLHVSGSDAVTLSAGTSLPMVDVVPLLRHRRRITVEAEFPLANSARHAKLNAHLYRVADQPHPGRTDTHRRVTFETKPT